MAFSCAFGGVVVIRVSFDFVIRHSDLAIAVCSFHKAGLRTGGGSWAFPCPVWRILQPVQHLSRFRHQQYAFALAVCELFGANPVRVAVTEVDTLALRRRDLGGQCYARARSFDSVFKSAQTIN